MEQTLTDISNVLKYDDSLFAEKIGTLEKGAVDKRIAGDVTPIIWIAGHLTNCRVHLLDLLGTEREFKWTPLFEKPYDPAENYPDISELKDIWMSVSSELHEALARATEEQLSAPLKYELPHGNSTVRGAFTFFYYHEAWHLGQIAYVRRGLGMEGLVVKYQ